MFCVRHITMCFWLQIHSVLFESGCINLCIWPIKIKHLQLGELIKLIKHMLYAVYLPDYTQTTAASVTHPLCLLFSQHTYWHCQQPQCTLGVWCNSGVHYLETHGYRHKYSIYRHKTTEVLMLKMNQGLSAAQNTFCESFNITDE